MKHATCIVGLFATLSGLAQNNTPSVINAAGGSAKSGYYHFEWSVGELSLVNQMNSSSNTLIVTNGFLQPYTLYPVFSNQNNYFGNEEIKVFPNPASVFVEIDFFTKQKGKIMLTFYDAAGKTVYVKELRSNGVDLIEKIPVSHFAGGVYALLVELEADAGFISKRGVYKITKIN